MVKNYMISFTAELENIASLEAMVDKSFVGYHFKIKCCCGEVREKEITLIPDHKWSDIRTAPSPKLTCKHCDRSGAVSVVARAHSVLSLEESQRGVFVPLIELRCDLFEPFEVVFSKGWRAVTINGSVLPDVDLSTSFYDYDEAGVCQVSVCGVRAMIEVREPAQHHKKSDRRG